MCCSQEFVREIFQFSYSSWAGHYPYYEYTRAQHLPKQLKIFIVEENCEKMIWAISQSNWNVCISPPKPAFCLVLEISFSISPHKMYCLEPISVYMLPILFSYFIDFYLLVSDYILLTNNCMYVPNVILNTFISREIFISNQ